MNAVVLEAAKKRVPCVPLLVNVVSRRVRQLNAGLRPYLMPLDKNESTLDLALREIADGKLTAEIGFVETEPEILPPPVSALTSDETEAEQT